MQDLEIARKRLCGKRLTLCAVKDGEVVFETGGHGISGMLEAVEKACNMLSGASVADKVVGKAIALLCVYAKVKAVYALTLSRKGKSVLEENAVHTEWGNLVGDVLSVDKTGTCPFEKLVAEVADPIEALGELRAWHDSLKRCR